MRRVLSLDGGGIKGVFQASFLSTVEDSIGGAIGDYFDLIVGTSTGGILALGLGLGLPAKRILEFYENYGPHVFEVSLARRLFPRLFLSKYKQKPLRDSLKTVFGAHLLGDSKTRLSICSTNLETGEVYVFKTRHHPRFVRDYKIPMVNVALATAAAPTYFPAFRSIEGTPLADGGIWANNPLGFACIEAVATLDWPRDQVRVLSLGTTREALNIGVGRKIGFGILYWVAKIDQLFLTAQSSASMGIAEWIVGRDNVRRIDPYVPPGRFGLDVTPEIPSLMGLGDSEARKALPMVRGMFFSEPAETFVPYS